MAVSPRKPRDVDHLVLPVTSLGHARERMTRLGFTVAADAIHPFGTENACIYLPDGTFLEPLAIHQRETCEAEAIKGNVFVGHDQAYRFRQGQEGFSALVFKTTDAPADHKRFRKLGFSAGKEGAFSRTFTDAKGKQSEASFRMAFARDPRAPDALVFTCHRMTDNSRALKSLQSHDNGALSMREIIISETNPSDFQYFLQEVINQRDINAHSFGIELQSGNANIAAYTPAGLNAWFGITDVPPGRGLYFMGCVIAVSDLKATAKLLKRNKVETREIAGRIVVAPQPGQGTLIAFEAAR